jgi:hypothetical protein
LSLDIWKQNINFLFGAILIGDKTLSLQTKQDFSQLFNQNFDQNSTKKTSLVGNRGN